MAYYVEKHYNARSCSIIPGYWMADNAPITIPCDTEEQALYLERHIEENDGAFLFNSLDAMIKEMEDYSI